MNDSDKAEEWLNALKHVRGRDLCWHLEGVLSFDGERVLNELLKKMGIKTAIDLVRRSA